MSKVTLVVHRGTTTANNLKKIFKETGDKSFLFFKFNDSVEMLKGLSYNEVVYFQCEGIVPKNVLQAVSERLSSPKEDKPKKDVPKETPPEKDDTKKVAPKKTTKRKTRTKKVEAKDGV